jgi:hypothetical protein
VRCHLDGVRLVEQDVAAWMRADAADLEKTG